MSKKQFEIAKAHIVRKEYIEAREILKSIDHPTARDWERKLDQIDPITNLPPPIGMPPDIPPPRIESAFKPTTGCLIIVAIMALVYLAWPNKPLAPAASLNTATPSPTATSSATPTLTPSATMTFTPTATATFTQTPTPTATYTASPTATNTPKFMAIDDVTYYSVSTVNLRSCPSTDCYMIENLPANTAVIVTGMIEGEALDPGNPNWYRIRHSEDEEYAYSKYFTLVRPTQIGGTATPTSGG